MQVKQNWKITVQYIMILYTALQLEAEHKSHKTHLIMKYWQ